MSRNLINFVVFQLGWFACVLSAANGRPLLGLLVVSLIVTGHIIMSERPSAEAKLVFLAVVAGVVFDSFLLRSGWLQYAGGMLFSGIAPYWILAMWALFATTLNASMGWLRNKLLLASALGAVFGPLSYMAGQRLGALQIINSQATLVSLALIWALAMPLLMFAAGRFNRSPGLAPIAPTHDLPGEQ